MPNEHTMSLKISLQPLAEQRHRSSIGTLGQKQSYYLCNVGLDSQINPYMTSHSCPGLLFRYVQSMGHVQSRKYSNTAAITWDMHSPRPGS